MAVVEAEHGTVAETAAKRLRIRNYLGRSWPLYAMMVLPVIQLALFHYYPMYGVVIAFQDFNPGLGFGGSPWVGDLSAALPLLDCARRHFAGSAVNVWNDQPGH